jgi:hypothetical protein
MTERRKYWMTWTVRVVALIALGAGIAYAAIPGPTGTISACYNAANGAIRVIDVEAGASCRPGEQMLGWSQLGVPGYEIVTNATPPSSAVLALGSFSANCPAGKRVLGGGGTVTTPEGGFTSAHDAKLQYFPTADGSAFYMAYNISNPTSQAFVRTVYAICGTVGLP